MIIVYQSKGSLVPPLADARLYSYLSCGAVGVVIGCEITYLGGLQLKISSGWILIQGHCVEVQEETITVTPATDGTVTGRLILQLDTSSDDSPAIWITQAENPLPELIQEDTVGSGSIYQYAMATYNVSQISLSDLTQVANVIGHQHPIGYIFDWAPVAGQSTDLSTPEKVAAYFGYGTWKELNGVFTFARDDAHAVGSTGGEETHALTEPEGPKHSHTTAAFVLSQNNSTVGGGTIACLYGANAGSGTGSSGEGRPHNNMPPYLTVYKWQRIA